MKRVLLAMGVTVAACAGWAVWESSLRPFCASSFEQYTAGQPLTNGTAVTGGYWSVPANTDTLAEISDGRYSMSFSTSETNGIVLNASAASVNGNDKAITSSITLVGCETLPEMDAEKDRVALIVYAPEDSRVAPTFQGWSADGWQTLADPTGTVNPVSGAWYEVSIRLMADAKGTVRAQYRIQAGSDYVPLQTVKKFSWDASEGKYWIKIIGTQSDIQEMEVRGTGNFEYLEGSEMKNGLILGVHQGQ